MIINRRTETSVSTPVDYDKGISLADLQAFVKQAEALARDTHSEHAEGKVLIGDGVLEFVVTDIHHEQTTHTIELENIQPEGHHNA